MMLLLDFAVEIQRAEKKTQKKTHGNHFNNNIVTLGQ